MTYEEPVASLLTLGPPADGGWRDYSTEFDLTIMHLPMLRELMLDDKLIELEPDEEPGFWGPVHALRAASQLGEVDALLQVSEQRLNPDAIWHDFPAACVLSGPRVMPGLLDAFTRQAEHLYTGSGILAAMERLAQEYPELQEEFLRGIATQLEQAETNDPTVNGMIVNALKKHDVHDALPVIEAAYKANSVDKFEAGDWESVQVAFGVKEPEEDDSGKNSLQLFREMSQELKQVDKGDGKKKRKSRKKRKRK